MQSSEIHFQAINHAGGTFTNQRTRGNGLSRGQGIRPSARPIEAYCHFSTFFARIAYGNFTMNHL
ncbi:hypothetical protein [Sporolactobacillus terrae]|uniref:hypothetical protein n=1 Tax=Sporolactobacillus terrae TaxID=269673 RepID=UPI00048C0ED7|nr:hypothetical protein [Sporolactobacillus terrae]